MLRLILLLSVFWLAACSSAAEPRLATPSPLAEVDYSCQVDTDCVVKNVGNCCGEYPACVNRDSPTFPDQVREACVREGRMAVCGFPSIAGCRCVERRCAAVTGPVTNLESQ